MKKIYGMTIRDWKKVEKLLNQPTPPHTETLKEHIKKNNLTTEERTSTRGIQLVKVYFANGLVREYEKKHLDTIKFFGIK